MKQAVEQALKRLEKEGATDYIVSGHISRSSQIKYSDNKVNATMDWDSASLNVFASFRGRIVSTSIRDTSNAGIERGISMVSKFARNLPVNHDFKGIAKGPFKYKDIDDVYDKNIESLGERSIDILESGINSALNNGAKRASGVLETAMNERFVMTSNNVQCEEKGTSAYFSIRAFLEKNSSGHKVLNSTNLKRFDTEKHGKEAAEIAVMAKDPVNGKPGKYDILFSPLAFANIIERVGDAASAFSIESGMSFLADYAGKKMSSDKVTIHDNGTLAGGIGSRKCDDEGTPSQNTILIDKGVLKTYLHNYSSAQRFNAKPTSNAGLISPHSTNLIMTPGSSTKDNMIKNIKNGLYITNVWYTRFQNYQTGDFSTIPRDGIFLVKDGEITQSIQNIRLSENMLNIMKNISDIGKDSEQIMGWEVESPVIIPLVFVKNLNITISK